MQSDLLELKNLGNTSIHWLHVIGINSASELKAIGAVEAYIRIKQRNIKVSKVFLYALQGAMDDIYWNDLEPECKQRLLDQVQQHSALKDPA